MSFPAVPAVNLRRLTLKGFLKLSLLVILYAICFFLMFHFEYKETGWFHSPLTPPLLLFSPSFPYDCPALLFAEPSGKGYA